MNKTKLVSQSTITRRKNVRNRKWIILASASWTGGIVPALAFAVAHFQAPSLFDAPWTPQSALWLFVVGALTYSAPMVVNWFSRFVGVTKAVGFVLCLEGCLVWTDMITAVPALLTLIAINAYVLADRMSND